MILQEAIDTNCSKGKTAGCLRKAVKSPSLEIFKTLLDKPWATLSNCEAMTSRGPQIILLSPLPSPSPPKRETQTTRNFSSSALYPHLAEENMSIQAHYSSSKTFLITTLPWITEMLMFPQQKRKYKREGRWHDDTATYWSWLETYNERCLFWKT